MTDSVLSTPTTPPLAPLSQRFPRRLAILVSVAAVVVLFAWILGTPSGVMGKADAIGYAICHQIAGRSFLIDGIPMPLCARCTGIYLGVMTGLMIAIVSGRARVRRMPPLKVCAVLAIFVVIMGIDGVNSYFHLFPGVTGIYEPHNWLRLVTGMFCGIAVFQIVFPVFNDVVWREADPRRSLNNFEELIGVCAVAVVVILLVLTERPTLLWILGIISTIGVVFALTMIGTAMFLSITRLDRRAMTWRELAFPLLAGLTLAIIEVGLIDILRFALTGTWNGFSIG